MSAPRHFGTHSTLRLGDNASIISATGDGIQAGNLGAVRIDSGNVVVQGNGAGAFGVNCFPFFPMGASASSLTGNLAGVSGTAGASSTGCDVFR